MTVPYVENVKLSLIVELVDKEFERYPKQIFSRILGIKIPKIKILEKYLQLMLRLKLNSIKLEIMSKRILIITGLSGAGRTSALKIFEDVGFEAIDNLPFFFLSTIVDAKIKKDLAVGIDIRSRDFDSKKIVKLIKNRKEKVNISVVFFDCDNQKLINRYVESRRMHPLKLDLPMDQMIERERDWVDPLKKMSDYYFDTTDLTINLLRKKN